MVRRSYPSLVPVNTSFKTKVQQHKYFPHSSCFQGIKLCLRLNRCSPDFGYTVLLFTMTNPCIGFIAIEYCYGYFHLELMISHYSCLPTFNCPNMLIFSFRYFSKISLIGSHPETFRPAFFIAFSLDKNYKI